MGNHRRQNTGDSIQNTEQKYKGSGYKVQGLWENKITSNAPLGKDRQVAEKHLPFRLLKTVQMQGTRNLEE